MTLELNKAIGQIDAMGQELASRARRQRHCLPAALELLRRFADRQAELRQIAGRAGERLRCASPGSERLDSAWAAPAMPDKLTVVAADASQIYPDPHGLAFYFLINVGSIVFRHGSGQAPVVGTRPRLYYTEDEVYPGGDPVTGDLVGALRSLEEMRALADLSQSVATEDEGCVAFTDGPLLPSLPRLALPRGTEQEILAQYLDCLGRLRALAVSVCGFVSRPRSAEVVALLYLAQCDLDGLPMAGSLHETPYRGLADRALFGFLERGERSALFVRGTAENQAFQARGHAVHFCYFNTGSDVARLEVPEWVADSPALLDRVHAAAWEQCRPNNGYPYVLTRADEQAVISSDERSVLEEMIARSMVGHGLDWPEVSRKAAQKRVARWRR